MRIDSHGPSVCVHVTWHAFTSHGLPCPASKDELTVCAHETAHPRKWNAERQGGSSWSLLRRLQAAPPRPHWAQYSVLSQHLPLRTCLHFHCPFDPVPPNSLGADGSQPCGHRLRRIRSPCCARGAEGTAAEAAGKSAEASRAREREARAASARCLPAEIAAPLPTRCPAVLLFPPMT